MEPFTFVKDYKTNHQLRASFNELATNTFGIYFAKKKILIFMKDMALEPFKRAAFQ